MCLPLRFQSFGGCVPSNETVISFWGREYIQHVITCRRRYCLNQECILPSRHPFSTESQGPRKQSCAWGTSVYAVSPALLLADLLASTLARGGHPDLSSFPSLLLCSPLYSSPWVPEPALDPRTGFWVCTWVPDSWQRTPTAVLTSSSCWH